MVSTRGMFEDPEAEPERLVFPDWSPKIVDGVPFVLVDPQGRQGAECRAALRSARQVPPAHAQIRRTSRAIRVQRRSIS